MDKASDFESEDCEFESRRGQSTFEGKNGLSYFTVNSLSMNIDCRSLKEKVHIHKGCSLVNNRDS